VYHDRPDGKAYDCTGVPSVGTSIPSIVIVCERRASPPCGHWFAGLDGRFRKSWVLGFLSGVGYLASSADLELKPTDHAAVEAWMDQYCTTHPLVTVAEGAHALIAELRTR
jgi:hypothetical protein